jgi:signal transduction histidine kinase
VILTAIKNGRFNPAHDARGEVPESAPGVKPGEAMPLETDGAPDTARQQVPPFFAKMLNIVAAAALISVIHQSVFVVMTGRAGLFEYIAVPLFVVFVAPTIFYFTVNPARHKHIPRVIFWLYWGIMGYIGTGFLNSLSQGLGTDYGIHFAAWAVIAYLIAVATQPVRRAQMMCWSGFASLCAISVFFLVYTGADILTDPLTVTFVSILGSQAAAISVLYVLSVFRQEQLADRQRAKVWQHASEEMIRYAQQADRARRDAEEARTSAEAAMRMRDRFVANISHELRTPLNAILGFAEVIERETYGSHSDDRYGEYAGDIRRSGRHLLGLINQILDFSRMEAGEINLKLEKAEAREVVSESLRLIAPLAEAKPDISVQFEPGPSIPLTTDTQALRQIVTNLVSNAIKFTDRGYVDVRLNEDGPDGLLLCVSDTGCGLSEDARRRVFTPFYRVARQGNDAGGTGLGLAIVKSLVEGLGGTIDVESQPGRGSTFKIRLPRRMGERTDSPVASVPAEPSEPAPQNMIVYL